MNKENRKHTTKAGISIREGEVPNVAINDCSFVGVQMLVARGLVNLTELFHSQDVNIECMMQIGKPMKVADAESDPTYKIPDGDPVINARKK